MIKSVMRLMAVLLALVLVQTSAAYAATGPAAPTAPAPSNSGFTLLASSDGQSATLTSSDEDEAEEEEEIEDEEPAEIEEEEEAEEPEESEELEEEEDLDDVLQALAGEAEDVNEELDDGITVTLPQDGSVTSDAGIDISGIAKEGYTIVVKVETATGEQTFTLTADASGAFNLADLGLEPGKNKIAVKVFDLDGNKVGEVEKRVIKPGVALTGLDDVKGNWAEQAIAKLVAMGIVSGTPDGSFLPDEHVTGAQFAKMLDLAANLDLDGAKLEGFEDLPEGFWATDYIAAAQSQGIIKGDDDQAFDANQPLTRVQIAVLLVRALGLEDQAEALSGNASLTFTDATSIPEWAQGYAQLAAQLGLVQGMSDGSFQPNAPANRAQAAALIERFLKQMEA